MPASSLRPGFPPRAPAIRSRWRLLGALLGLSLLPACSTGPSGTVEWTVAAASSLRRVMPELIASFHEVEAETVVRATFGASGALRRQVEGGAPIDVVVFASAEEVGRLIDGGLCLAASRRAVAGNRLVLVGSEAWRDFRFQTLADLPPEARIAVGDPRTVPAGAYARQALESLGLWETLRPRLVLGAHAAAVLAYARRGEADLAVVYETDTRELGSLKLIDRAEGPWAPRPQVVAALTVEGDPRADRFLTFLSSSRSREILRRHGFTAAASHAGL